MEFFRIGDIVEIKSLEDLVVGGIQVNKEVSDDFTVCSYCRYKGEIYSIFEDDEHLLVGRIGIIRGGIYDKYLEVQINDSVYMLPHFVLRSLTNEVINLEENTYHNIEE